MLTIDATQEKKLIEAAFIARLDDFILELQQDGHCSPTIWTDARLRDDCRRWIAEGCRLGLRSGRDILGFLTLRHAFGPAFLSVPGVVDALGTPSRPEGMRIMALLGTIEGHQWLSPGPTPAPVPAGV